MKVYLQIIDTLTGVYQTGMINEPVSKGNEIKNAIKHFCSSTDIEWEVKNPGYYFGKIMETSKVISIVTI